MSPFGYVSVMYLAWQGKGDACLDASLQALVTWVAVSPVLTCPIYRCLGVGSLTDDRLRAAPIGKCRLLSCAECRYRPYAIDTSFACCLYSSCQACCLLRSALAIFFHSSAVSLRDPSNCSLVCSTLALRAALTCATVAGTVIGVTSEDSLAGTTT